MTDRRFLDLADIAPQTTGKPLNVLLLADDVHVANVVQDHINAFKAHSQHRVQVVNPIHTKVLAGTIDPAPDAILIHYSIFILGDYYLPGPWRTFVRIFPGPKAQIIQDEYRHINAMKSRMVELGVSAVFSSLTVDNLPQVYGGETLEGVHFYSSLPGYIADNFKTFCPPLIEGRPLDIVYRGRELPFHNGRGVREKIDIGNQMLALAKAHALNVDISSKEEARIYGRGWIDFLNSARTTLGVEGGVSIFDFDDAIEASCRDYIETHPGADFEAVWQAVLKPHEGNIVHRTITPKLFEAVASKTALVLYPGRYRGILVPHRHYIPLAPDGSNAADVVAKIKDAAYLQDLVDRTYAELMDRDDLSTSFYVRQVDAALSQLQTGARQAPEVVTHGRAAAFQAAVFAQIAADETALRIAAEQVAAQERILREHAEFVQQQQEQMRLAADNAAREQERIEREHAEFVRLQQEEMRPAAEEAARQQARIEREHAESVEQQKEQMRLAAANAAREQELIERAHAEFVEQQREQMRLAAANAAREQERIEREHAEFVEQQREQMRLAAANAAREQERIEREHAEFVRLQQEEMRLAAEQAAHEQARIELERAELLKRQRLSSPMIEKEPPSQS